MTLLVGPSCRGLCFELKTPDENLNLLITKSRSKRALDAIDISDSSDIENEDIPPHSNNKRARLGNTTLLSTLFPKGACPNFVKSMVKRGSETLKISYRNLEDHKPVRIKDELDGTDDDENNDEDEHKPCNVESLLIDAYEAVKTLDPDDETIGRQQLERASDLTCRILDRIHAVASANNIELEGWRPRRLSTRKDQLAAVLEAVSPNKLGPADVCAALSEKKISHGEAERRAFARLLTGYSNDPDIIKTRIGSIDSQVQRWNAVCDDVERRNSEPSLDRRLLLQNRALVEAPGQDTIAVEIERYVRFVLKTVEVIKFASEYNDKSLEAGGKKWKTAFRLAAFEDECADQLGVMRRQLAGQNIKKAETKLLKTFTRRFENATLARNQLLRLYRKVGGASKGDRD